MGRSHTHGCRFNSGRLLSPQEAGEEKEEEEGMSILVNIDAGHGSNTAGKRTPPLPVDVDLSGDGQVDYLKGEQIREHHANTYVANYLAYELARCGIAVNRTGWDDADAYDDPDTAISVRQSQVKARGCTVSVSIHFNAFGDGKAFNSANGLGVFVHSEAAKRRDSEALAQILHRYLMQGTPQKDRGVKAANLGMCNALQMGCRAAVLVELAFMTNEHEALTMMASDAYYQESARELAQGLCEYLGIRYIPVGEAASSAGAPNPVPNPEEPTQEIQAGDQVTFTGGVHYTNSYAHGTAKACKPGPAKVLRTDGKVHKYQLKAVADQGSTVNGWVDAADVKR